MSMGGIEGLALKRGEIAFLWFNRYSGMVIKTPTKILVVDPCEISPKDLGKVDAILLTHEHYDHLDESLIGDVYSATNCLVIADPTSHRRLHRVVSPENLLEARVGKEFNIGKVVVHVEPCNHPPAATPVTFLITSEDGVTLYHTADSLPFPEMRRISQDYKPDVAFCTIGIAPGASPATGVEVAKLIQPKVTVPYHGFKFSDFEKILAREAPNIRCLLIEKGRAYKYP